MTTEPDPATDGDPATATSPDDARPPAAADGSPLAHLAHADDPAAPPLLRHLDRLARHLVEQAAAVLQADSTDAVHQSRVTTRRLKAACDLLEPILAGKARRHLNRVLRKVRRRLGPMRDIDVMIGHLRDFAGEPGCGPAAQWLTEELEHDRLDAVNDARCDKTLARLASKLRPWGKLRGQVARNEAAVDRLLAESLHRQLDAFAARAGELDASAEDAPHGVSVDPHAVRIEGKALRYTIEMAQAHGHPLAEEITRTFKKMQDALGLWHDHVVLTEQAMLLSGEAMLTHHNLPLQQSVLDLAQASLKEAGRQLDKFRRLWREHGEALAAEIRAAYPAPPAGAPPAAEDGGNGDGHGDAAAATEPGTDPDPAGSPGPADQDGPH